MQKCQNTTCKWRGRGGECRLFEGTAATECNYRGKPARASAKTRTTRKGK